MAFDGEKVMATNLVHILDSTKEKSKTQVGNRLHPGVPVPPSLPLPSPTKPPGGLCPSLQLTGLCPAARRDLGKGSKDRKQQRQEGGQEEADKTPASLHSALQPSGEQSSVSKNIYSESKLIRYYISTDNGRM